MLSQQNTYNTRTVNSNLMNIQDYFLKAKTKVIKFAKLVNKWLNILEVQENRNKKEIDKNR